MAEDETAEVRGGTVTSDDGKKVRRVRARDFNKLADEVKQTFNDRKDRRRDLEKDWDEIDRQVRMEAVPASTRVDDGTDRTWMAAVEMPWQASSLDILPKDTMRLIFPPGDDWYKTHVILDDEWIEKVMELGLIAGVKDDPGVGRIEQVDADMILKSVLEHFHNQYDFRRAWKNMINEAVKYGTYAGRALLVDIPEFTEDFRGTHGRLRPIPALVPVSIRNLLLDDSVQHALHEGKVIRPAHIRQWFQRLEDLKRAAKQGARADENGGWMPAMLNKMKPLEEGDKKDHVELLEMEGDMMIERADEVIYLPNHIITVAVGNMARVVRLRAVKTPFRSYLTGVYDQDDIRSVYGSCPLLKGRPLQVAGTEIANRMINSAALNAEPTVAYDADDTQLTADGGPVFAPGKLIKADNPDSIREFRGGDLGAFFGTWNGIKQAYEETLHIQDPRRGADVKSHTTAFANQLVQARSLLPTEDFALDVEASPVVNWLYRHHALAIMALDKPTEIRVSARGVDGHFLLQKEHIDVGANFTVEGSRGLLTREEKKTEFVTYYRTMVETAQLKSRIPGAPLPNFKELDAELAALHGITDAARFTIDPDAEPEAAAQAAPTEGFEEE